MDYNSLSDEDLIALSSKKYDALSDDGLIFLANQNKIGGFAPAAERNFVKAATNISGGLSKYLGFPGGSDEQTHAAVESQMNELRKPDHWYSPESLGAITGQAGVALPAMAAAAPVATLAGAELGLGGLGTAALTGLAGSTLTAPGAAFDAETSAKKYTSDPNTLNQIAANAAFWETAGNMLPGQGKLLGRAVKGAAQNVGADVLSSYSHNAITDGQDKRLQKDPWDVDNLITSAVVGGAFGAATGSKPGERWLSKNEAQAPKEKNPYATYESDKEDFNWKLNEDISRQVDVLRSEEQSIRDQLSRQTDPNSEFAQQLQLDLRNISNNRIELEKVLAQEEIKVGETGKPVDAEREAAQASVKALEQEAAQLAVEYQALSKKGAALTPEEKIRKEQLATRIEDLDAQQMDLVAKAHGEDVEPTNPAAPPAQPKPANPFVEEGRVDTLSPETQAATQGMTTKQKAYYLNLEKQLEYFTHKQNSNNGQDYTGIITELTNKMESLSKGTSNPKGDFVAGSNRGEVHQVISNTDMSGWDVKTLEDAIAHKQAKIDDFKSRDVGSPAQRQSLDGLISLMESERNMMISELHQRAALANAKGIDLTLNLAKEYIPDNAFNAGVRTAMGSGGLLNALQYMANYKHPAGTKIYGRFYSELSKAIINNPLARNLVHKVDPNAEFHAQYNNHTGEIIFRTEQDMTPSSILHETVHAMANRALAMVSAGMGHKLDVKASVGARKLNDLHRLLSSPKNMALLGRVVGDQNAKAMMANPREFLAYGLTDSLFQHALSQIKSNGTSYWSRMKAALGDMFTTNTHERSALDDVLEYGNFLIVASDVTAPKHLIDSVDPQRILSVRTSPEGILRAIRNGSLSVFSHLFTAQLPQLMRHNAMFTKWNDTLDKIHWRSEALSIEVLFGKGTPNATGKGFFFKKSGPQAETAVNPSLYKVQKDEHIAEMWDKLMDGYRKGIDAEETIKANEAGWTPEQTRLARALAHSYQRLAEEAWRMYGRTDLPSDLKQRVGYMLTNRVGNYGLTVSVNGIPLRQQNYLTAAEANHWAQKFRDADPRAHVETHSRTDKDNTKNLIDFIESLNTVDPKNLSEHLAKKLMDLETENSSIGGHTMRSSILSGFIGDQAGVSTKERGRLLREAIPRAINNYVDNIYSREIQKSLIDFHIDNDGKMDDTTKSLIDFYTRTKIDRPYVRSSEGGSGGKAAQVTVREAAHDLSEAMRETISTGIDGMFGYKNRDKHAIDRFMGLFGTVFHTFNITMKPAIWVAQPLQALMSVRSAFKNGESPRQVLMAFGESLVQIAGQRMLSDADFKKAMDAVSQSHNTLHPQMINEYNSLQVGADPNSVLNRTISLGTGQTFSAMGDKFSRFASFTFFYNLHKRSGLTGETLYRKAAQDTTDNMYAYGAKNMPAIYREMGMFGEQGSPLMTFAHGQLGNMIVDVKEFMVKPGFATAAPLILSAGVMMILGGAVSLPILAEYELIRQAAIGMGVIGPDQWKSASSMISDNTPAWFSHGILSDMSGIDLDASMRYTSLLNKIKDVESNGMLALFPHLAWGTKAVSGATTLIKAPFTETDTPVMDKALKDTLPKGPVAGAVENLRNTGNLFTRMGPKGQPGVLRDMPEAIAPWIGSRSLGEALVSTKLQEKKQLDDAQRQLIQEIAIAAQDGHGDKVKNKMTRLVKNFFKGDHNAAEAAINKQFKASELPAIVRAYMDDAGYQTPEQESAMIRDNMGAFYKKLYGEKKQQHP